MNSNVATSVTSLREILASAGRSQAKIVRAHKDDGPRLARLAGSGNDLISLDLSGLAGIESHNPADQVVSVAAGTRLADLDRELARTGQWLPVAFRNEDTSLADAIDTGDGGYLETLFGGMRSLVLGMELALITGDSVKTGGKVVKNVTGYDLAKLFTGSHSWLAIPHLVHLRLFARPEQVLTLTVEHEDPSKLFAAGRELLRSGLPLTALEIAGPGLVGGNENAMMLVACHGNSRLAKESIEAAGGLLEKMGLVMVSNQGETIEQLSLLASCDSDTASRCLEISATIASQEVLLKSLREMAPLHFVSRPQTGRLRILSPAESTIDSTSQYQTWSDFLRDQNIPHSYSSPDMRRVFLNSGSGTDKLKKSLKDRFDPHHCLNPLVRFF
ncbi:MAG: FAD-binding oxidoreductase [Cyanobacteria bacterium HKST-UBA02]|nr:FAD-binding oxidoreductase [Cyanobacteria bacterium HKST-UBA02]